jgi:predicted transposase/invertase (TIGR01784 family)
MKPGIDPKVDYAFKWLFGKEAHVALLLSLVNAVLRLPAGHWIVSLEILNPFNDKQALDDKLSILDIKARDQLGRQYNIEMQMLGSPILLRRLLYYWAVLHADQLHEGQDYTQLRPTITICFVNAELFADLTDHHLHFQLRSDKYPQLLFSDHESIHLVELPKFKLKANELVDPLDAWCYFLIHGETMDMADLPENLRRSPVEQAMEKLQMFAQDKEEKERYQARLKAQRDYSSFLKEAREEAEKQGLEKGMERGLEQGLEKGEILGRILLSQQLLKQPTTPRQDLAALSLEELQAMLRSLEKQLIPQ